MTILSILLATLLILAAATVAISYICYRIAFYAPEHRAAREDEFPLPSGSIYEPFHEQMIAWIKQIRNLPHEDVQITSFDGLTLRGKYYERHPGAPIELMIHGYRGNAEQDMNGGVMRAFRLGRNALLIDQRGSGASEGNAITFGVKESEDCLAWVEFLRQKFGPDVKIILTGISMGAATVMIAAGKELPDNVIGVLADCGYTSAEDIMKIVIRQMKLPPKISYPFVKLAAKLFAGFDLEDAAPIRAMERCRVPVIFFHGMEDDFVPCDMSRQNYNACNARKKLVLVPSAGHGLSYPVAPEYYLQELAEFFGTEVAAE